MKSPLQKARGHREVLSALTPCPCRSHRYACEATAPRSPAGNVIPALENGEKADAPTWHTPRILIPRHTAGECRSHCDRWLSLGLPIAIMADVHYMREAAMRLVACLTMCLMPILANAAQMDAQVPSDPQAYCVNRSADFYPYTGEPCKSGYQLGSGNCRKTDGRMVAVPREQCVAMAGTVELPFEGGRRPFGGPQAPKNP
jgi:hypothetical protein